MGDQYYITTPIYYVNDRPHIGHCYTTLVADIAARTAALIQGQPIASSSEPEASSVFFLTGTDEHAEKVISAASERGLSPQQWADRNAGEFRKAFDALGCSYSDFIRTSEQRHVERVLTYIGALKDSGDVYLGDYVGWYDPSQEEYLTENVAREHDFASPVTGRPLEKRTEKNYFFKLSSYQDKLLNAIESGTFRVLPEARKNEVVSRIRQGLQDVPISRAVKEGEADWGILMPGDDSHRIYVWIDALFNYFSAVDTPQRKDRYWPATVHLIAKDILWFHAVIWPAMLMALGEALPGCVYAHSYWIREGKKMSKSLGNFLELETIDAYCQRYSTDAIRWYLATQGPLGVTDSDFAHAKFVEVYNADLANGIGNSTSRVSNMIAKYFGGAVPSGHDASNHAGLIGQRFFRRTLSASFARTESFEIDDALVAGIDVVRAVDRYIADTVPFKIAKTAPDNPEHQHELEIILYNCAEALRIASLLLAPAMPTKMSDLWERWGCAPEAGVPLAELAAFAGPHALTPGQHIEKGDALFMRADADEPAPGAVE